MEQKPRVVSNNIRRDETMLFTSMEGALTTISPKLSVNTNTKPLVVQNFRLIWLDANIDESNEDFLNFIKHLRCIVNIIDPFTDADQCIDFLSDVDDEMVFMIVSCIIGQSIIPLIHDISHLNSIFVFCDNQSPHERWAKEWPKMKGVFTQTALICDAVQKAARQCDQDLISINFVQAIQTLNPNLNRQDQSFMYTQLFKEILLEVGDDDRESIKGLVDYCREQNIDSSLIAKFEAEYCLHTPIWWYTWNGFLYSMINRALRTLEVTTLLKVGFFIRHLHQHIQRLYLQRVRDYQDLFTVYRGQGLPQTSFEKLVQTKGGLLSFNNFLSTSIHRDVAVLFAESNAGTPHLMGILFEITINRSISSIAFTFLDDISNFSSEGEVLFSMHTVFRIGEIKQMDNSNSKLWHVKLVLTSDNDPQLTALTTRMREEIFIGSKGWYQLGQLLIKLGVSDKAKQLYKVLLNQITNEDEKGHIYHMLGYAEHDQGKYQKAISSYKKTLEIYQKTLPPNHSDLITLYNNIGGAYEATGNHSEALSSYETALAIKQKYLLPNHHSLATSYNNLGGLFVTMGEYLKACSFYEKAVEIWQKTLPPNHPWLAAVYNNIGGLYLKMGQCLKALSFQKKAFVIYQECLPPNHPDLATLQNNIGALYCNMREYSKALLPFEKALEIRQKSLPPNHPDMATSYNNIGEVYRNMGEYYQALSFYEKALEIYQKTGSSNHPNLAASYSNIGSVYMQMGEYSKALSFHEKAFEILEKVVPPAHPLLTTYRKNIEFARNRKQST
jgi:tetratricopeptide (TPR) repeat protein